MTRIEVKTQLGHDVVTREHGQKLRGLIEKALSVAPVIVDFEGMQITSVSFFDESFGVLAKQYGEELLLNKVKFERIDPFDLALVRDIVSSRGREAKKREASPRRCARALREKNMANKEILKARGFVEIKMRMLWISHDLRKAFSHDAACDYDPQLFKKCLEESVPDGWFRFYMGKVPDGFVENEAPKILKEIGLSRLRAEVPLSRIGFPNRRN